MLMARGLPHSHECISALNRPFRFFQMLGEVGHKRRAARADSGGITRMGLVLAEDISIGIPDVDFPELGE